MMLVFGWIFLAFMVGALAKGNGHKFWDYFSISCLLSPAVGIIWLFAVGKNHEALEQRGIKAQILVRCPFCKETIKSDAIKCKHCGSDIPLMSPEVKLVNQENGVVGKQNQMLLVFVIVIGIGATIFILWLNSQIGSFPILPQ